MLACSASHAHNHLMQDSATTRIYQPTAVLRHVLHHDTKTATPRCHKPISFLQRTDQRGRVTHAGEKHAAGTTGPLHSDQFRLAPLYPHGVRRAAARAESWLAARRRRHMALHVRQSAPHHRPSLKRHTHTKLHNLARAMQRAPRRGHAPQVTARCPSRQTPRLPCDSIGHD